MRWAAAIVFVSSASLVVFTACSSRTGDYPEDYTEEIERICENLCDKAATCVDPPFIESEEECLATCNGPGEMHDDNVCGEAFRDLFQCVGGTATCEEYLDTLNVDAEYYTCKEENLTVLALECGAQEGTD